MKKPLLFSLFGLFFLSLFLIAWSLPVQAAPELQLTPFLTPTPGGDGKIWYLVQPYDTLWRISAVSGVTLDELRNLNNLAPDDVLVEGDYILLGILASNAPTATIEPGTTGNLPQATATPEIDEGTASVCVILYDDQNGDALRQEFEGIIENGAVSLTEQTGKFSETRNTSSDEDKYCFNDLPGGKYNISMAIPDGYNPTTQLSTILEVLPGDSSRINFGAQQSTQTQVEEAQAAEPTSTRSPVLGIAGLALLLLGIGLGIFSSQANRK